jgi:hypothetical protein
MYKATWKVDENDEGSVRLCKHINYNKYRMTRNLNIVTINCSARSTKRLFVYSKLMLGFLFSPMWMLRT